VQYAIGVCIILQMEFEVRYGREQNIRINIW